jgi:UBX domain-containing protein 1
MILFSKIPSELIKKYKTAEIDAALEDKREEDYKPPPPPSYIAFSGQGVSMASSVQGGQVNVSAGAKPHVDSSKPKTKLTFRLHNGTTHQIEVNTHESTATIYNYVNR